MKRLLIILLIVLVVLAGALYLLDQYWIHRYDSLIAREAAAHHIDPDLVWSIVYEETYFSPWKKGRNGEIGLMQVTPVVAREWAAESGVAPIEQRTSMDTATFLRDPERNVQIGCWYLEKADQDYRNSPGREARILAAYNAGPSRAAEWSRVAAGAPPLSEQDFIARIDIPSTRAYVTSILDRYHRVRSAKNAAPAIIGLTTRGDGQRHDFVFRVCLCDFVDRSLFGDSIHEITLIRTNRISLSQKSTTLQ
jgi:soluble lytic murein transglycosylase